MERNYWSHFTNKRIGRRRALALSGGAAAAAAFLAACGGDDDDGGGGSSGTGGSGGTSGGAGGTGGASASGLVTKATYTEPGQAKRGGVFKDFMRAEPRSLDPVNPQADLDKIGKSIYSTLLAEKPGKLEPSSYELEGSLATSWEVAGDGLQLTFKLRPNVKFHNIAPVSGRALDVDDVLFSFQRHEEVAPLRSLLWDSVGAGGPILSASAPDASTVVLKLKDPVSYIANWFGSLGAPTGQFLIYPKEAADPGVFDIRQAMIGTGPFSLKAHEPSVNFILERNPDYWDQDFALVDEIQMPIVSEYAQRQAQFKAGELYYAGGPGSSASLIARAEDVLSLKGDQPKLLLYESQMNENAQVMTFGWLPVGQSPFQDVRVRQAFSRAYDRDLDIEVRQNVKEFETRGIPVRTVWNSHLAARDGFIGGGWFLDPQDSEFGPNAANFQYDVAEAKKLMAAAGFADGFEMKFSYPNAPQFDRASIVEPMFFYFQEIGVTVIDNGQEDYTQGYIPLNRDASGEFEGLGYHSVTGGIPSQISPTSALVAEHLPSSGVTFHGYDLNGRGDKSGDPELISILEKARVEPDLEAQKRLIKEAQRHLGGTMHNLIESGGATGYWLAWPAVQNVRAWESAGHPWEMYQLWLDQTKAPFA